MMTDERMYAIEQNVIKLYDALGKTQIRVAEMTAEIKLLATPRDDLGESAEPSPPEPPPGSVVLVDGIARQRLGASGYWLSANPWLNVGRVKTPGYGSVEWADIAHKAVLLYECPQ